jgi:hypothetical protein
MFVACAVPAGRDVACACASAAFLAAARTCTPASHAARGGRACMHWCAHTEMPRALRQLEAQRRAAAAAAAADPERVAADAAARARAAALRAQTGEEAQRMAAVALASATFTVRRVPKEQSASFLC